MRSVFVCIVFLLFASCARELGHLVVFDDSGNGDSDGKGGDNNDDSSGGDKNNNQQRG